MSSRKSSASVALLLVVSQLVAGIPVTAFAGQGNPQGSSGTYDPDLDRIRAEGRADGTPDGEREGRERGGADGVDSGKRKGYQEGYEQCLNRRKQQAYDLGYLEGQRQGEQEGIATASSVVTPRVCESVKWTVAAMVIDAPKARQAVMPKDRVGPRAAKRRIALTVSKRAQPPAQSQVSGVHVIRPSGRTILADGGSTRHFVLPNPSAPKIQKISQGSPRRQRPPSME